MGIRKTKSVEYQPSRIAPIIRIAARMIKEDPSILDDIDDKTYSLQKLKTALKIALPELGDKSKCPCCGESMAQYADTLDINDALLLINVAEIVKTRMTRHGLVFTDANKVRISSADIPHTQKCRTTKCSKLGLIAKAGNAEWSITRRGFDALAGKPVPKVRVTFRGKIIERPEVMTTFAQIFDEHRKKKTKKTDYTERFRSYNMLEWVTFAGYNKGNLI